jgi:LytS/YehU family sensor histidine kinase
MGDKSDLVVFLAITTVTLLVLFVRARMMLKKQRKVTNDLVRKRDDLIKERDKLIHKLELDSLKFQVSPHSLRNTLNVVKYYTETANLAVSRLTNVLDYLLYESSVDTILLPEEIKFAKNFHDLMKIRTSELVQTSFNDNASVHEKSQSFRVPPMITAYFLENAYKHGDLVNESLIEVLINIDADTLVYRVENSIKTELNPGFQKGGIGLLNMRKRLDILFKDKYSLATGAVDNKYIAELKIKL